MNTFLQYLGCTASVHKLSRSTVKVDDAKRSAVKICCGFSAHYWASLFRSHWQYLLANTLRWAKIIGYSPWCPRSPRRKGRMLLCTRVRQHVDLWSRAGICIRCVLHAWASSMLRPHLWKVEHTGYKHIGCKHIFSSVLSQSTSAPGFTANKKSCRIHAKGTGRQKQNNNNEPRDKSVSESHSVFLSVH